MNVDTWTRRLTRLAGRLLLAGASVAGVALLYLVVLSRGRIL